MSKIILYILLVITIITVNPYDVLQLTDSVDINTVKKKYSSLKKKNKRNKSMIKILNNAYQQIMIKNTLQMTLGSKDSQSQNMSNTSNEDIFIKDFNVDNNKRIAKLILFLGSILVKLSPCLIIWCIFKKYKQNIREQNIRTPTKKYRFKQR